MSTQLQLVNLQIPARRPLVPLEALVTLLDRDVDDIIALINLARLEYAWDIACKDTTRREIRVWRGSVMTHMENPLEAVLSKKTVDEILESLFPHTRDIIRSPELERMFSCSQPHVTRLINDGLIEATGWGPQNRPMDSRPAGSADGYARITRASIKSFLTKRHLFKFS